MVMATTKPISPPVRPADMTREEAETVTKQIKENFDSLGNMLLAAREQKAYKALGYRSFESYCQNEFGKSSSTAYQAIEDAKVRSQLEARISENYGEEVTLKFPSSHLRPLKAVGDLDDKLKVIEYAQKLAAGEGKKPTKQHLEIAVFEISGKRSEDFRSAIQKLGFTKGVQVEAVSPIKKDRGIVTHLDKAGLIYVEHYYGSTKAVPYRATELRILTNEEKPTNPLEGSVASKGDKVLIFAEGLQGKQGTIYTWQEGKTTLVMVDGQKSPTVIAYAELELIKTTQPKNADWESELVWESGKNTYYYFPREDKIYSNRWPVGLTLEPYTHSGSPIDFMKNWETRFSDGVLESLATPATLKTLVLQQAIEFPEQEGKEFVADLITSLNQLFPQASKPAKAMGISFSRTINELISGKKTQTRRAWQDDYAKNFLRYFDENIAIPALDKGRHRGGHELGFIKLTQRPYQQYLSEMSLADLQEEGGMVATVQEFIDTYFEEQDKLVWVLHFEFLATPNADNTDTLVAENQRLCEQLAKVEADRDDLLIRIAEAQNKYLSLKKKEIDPLEERLIQLDMQLIESEKELRSVKKDLELTIKQSQQGLLQEEISRIALSNSMLQERLVEAEAVIEAMVNRAGIASPLASSEVAEFLAGNTPEISTPGDTAAPPDFSVENTAETSSPGDTATNNDYLTDFLVENASDNSNLDKDDWRSVLTANDFSVLSDFWCASEPTEIYRDWAIYLDSPNGATTAIDLNHPVKGSFCRSTHDLPNSTILEFTKKVINQVEDFCPGQLAFTFEEETPHTELPPEISSRIVNERQKLLDRIEKYQQTKSQAVKKEIPNIEKQVKVLHGRLTDLQRLEGFRVGQTVCHQNRPMILGKIAGFDFSTGGMPIIWLRYFQDGELQTTIDQELVGMIFQVDI